MVSLVKNELENLGCKVIVPKFPTPENQSLESWFEVFDMYKDELNKDTIIIGHSLGGAFTLRILEKYDVKIKTAYIVAAPCNKVPSAYPGADITDLPFVGNPFNWDKIKINAENFVIIHSDNDPYIDIENSKEIASKLGKEVTLIPNSGHFNARAGFLKFEVLLDLIKKELV